MTKSALRIVIADDHRLFRQGLQSLLATCDDIEVVGEAETGDEAVVVVHSTMPDLVLMDLHMPAGSGLEATRSIVKEHPSVNVLILTMFDDDTSVFASLRAGARGYILKDADDDEFLRAIRTVGSGGSIYSPAIASRMSQFFASCDLTLQGVDPTFQALTGSERRVLSELARGLSNDAIAAALGYSPKTVRNYVSSIFGKLHVADRAQAIVMARDRGFENF